MDTPYTDEYFRSRRMGEALYDPYNTAARALKGYRRGVRMLGDLKGKRVLDVGCGLGAGSWLMSRQGAHVVGVDVSEDAIAWARDTYSAAASRERLHLEYWTVNLLGGLGGGLGTFDVLTVVDVLEHFPPDDGRELLKRLKSLLRPGGRMFLHVPVTHNTLDWVLVAKNGLVRKRLRGHVIDHHGDPTHRWRYSVHDLMRVLAETGWTTNKLELRAYKSRVRSLERAVMGGKWTAAESAAQQVVTDWDGVQGVVRDV